MFDSSSLPLNLARTGPPAAVMATLYSLSPTLSMVSQPGMHGLSTAGSLRAAHTWVCGTGMSCSPVISIAGLLVRAPYSRTHPWNGRSGGTESAAGGEGSGLRTGAGPRRGGADREGRWGRARAARRGRRVRFVEDPAQLEQAVDVMGRHEHVHVGQHR